MRTVLRAWVLFPLLAGPCDDGCEEFATLDVPVTGLVTIDGVPAQGVTLEARAPNRVLGQATTDASGTYELTAMLPEDVDPGFDVTVVSYPTATYGSDVVFRPATKTFEYELLSFTPADPLNFEGYSSAMIHGHARANGLGVPGVTIELRAQSGLETSALTGADGGFSFPALGADLYVLTPVPDPLIGLSWVPGNRATELLGQDQTLDFNAAFSPGGQITGRVSVNGQGLPDVRVDVNGPWPSHTTTDADGDYIFGSLPAGAHTVSISGYDATLFTFNPTSKPANVAVAQHPVVDFAGSIIVPNAPPAVSISAPLSSARFGTGTSIAFSGSATDAEDGALAGNALVWTSDRAGPIGTGTTFTRSDLSAGTHRITLTATDRDGATASASVTIDVVDNTAPSVTILTPTYDQAFYYGTVITFSADATDPEDGTLSGSSVVWTSDQDGQIGTGATLSRVLVGYSYHMITVTVTDSLGATASATIRIYVADPGLLDRE